MYSANMNMNALDEWAWLNEDRCASSGLTDSLQFIQLNCQRMYECMCDLSVMMVSERVSVALVQEPYVRNGRVCGLPLGMRVYVNALGSAAVIVNDVRLDCMMLGGSESDLGVAVRCNSPWGEFIVFSVYFSPSGDIGSDVEYLTNMCAILNGRIVIGIDANAANEAWHSKNVVRKRQNARRGEVLHEWLLHEGLGVMNVWSPTFSFEGSRGSSDIDITLQRGFEQYSWRIEGGVGISDHNPIRFSIVMSVGTSAVPRMCARMYERKWKDKETDWDSYKRILVECMIPYERFIRMNVHDRIACLEATIERVNDKCMKRARGGGIHTIKWWNDNLSETKSMVGYKRKLYQRAQRDRCGSYLAKLNAYKSARREYKKLIRDSKTNNWREFVRVEDARDPWGGVYRICKWGSKKKEITSVRTDAGHTTSWRDTAEAFLREFFPSGPALGNLGVLDNDANDHGASQSVSFTGDEFAGAYARMRASKAPGMDGYTNRMLRVVWQTIPEYMKAMYNACLNVAVFPESWKVARVVVIPKGPDKDMAALRSYRPICLLSGLGKALEYMMCEKMMKVMTNKWNDRQYGFVKGKCAEDAWGRLRCVVNECSKKYVLGVFVDFKGAFDYLTWPAVAKALAAAGCRGKEFKLWMSYFKDRRVCMVSSNECVTRMAERGCPQGSICGPFVWNLCMNELLNSLATSNIRCVAYADDLVILAEADSRAALEKSACEYMKIVYKWGEYVGVSVSNEKSVCMLLKGSVNVVARRLKIVTGGDCVPNYIRFVREVKWLGVTMAERFYFGPHVKSIRSKMNNAVSSFKRVMRTEWGLSLRTVRIMMNALFLPCAAYAASVWGECLRFEWVRKEMNRCQRVILYAGMSVCKTVSTEAMQVLAGMLPWDIVCKGRMNEYKIRRNMRMSESDYVSEDERNVLGMRGAKAAVRERMYDEWQERWVQTTKGRTTFEFINEVRFVQKHKWFGPSLYVSYLITGHGSLAESLHRRGLASSPECACGEMYESWIHVLCECCMYDGIRNLAAMGIRVTDDGWDVSNVLSSRSSYEKLKMYASEVFRRRPGLRAAAGMGGVNGGGRADVNE